MKHISSLSEEIYLFENQILSEQKGITQSLLRMEGGAGGGVGGESGEDTEKMWKYQWTMSPLLRSVSLKILVRNNHNNIDFKM